LRHGQSTFNSEGRFQGCSDEPVLTPAGIATAEDAAAYLQAADLDAVVTSPLRRASHTALRVYRRVWKGLASGPVFRLDEQLREIELPAWEGLTLESVKQDFAGQYGMWRDHPHLLKMPEGYFPVGALFRRASEFWSHLLRNFAGGNVLLVTHSGTGRALISAVMRIPQARFHSIQQCNGGISALEFPDQKHRGAGLLAVNATDYLGRKLPKLKECKTGLRLLLVPAGGSDEEQIRRVAEALESVRIDVVTADSVVNQEVALRLWRPGGGDVRVKPENESLQIPEDRLTTELRIVQESSLKASLADALGIDQADRARLRLVPFTLTVLHYPHPGSSPILQAMNMHDTRRLSL
jgi:probable phosphoglycerate mutase